MAHFAELDENNVVIRVNVVSNSELLIDGVESEEKGVQFLRDLYGNNANWKQTSYNGNFRKNYAGIGFTYNADIDAFVHPQPHPSWILNAETAQWEAPTAMPDDGHEYSWNEETTFWDVVETPAGNAD